MSDITLTGQTWVAGSPWGAIGSIHRVEGGFVIKMLSDERFRGVYPTLDIAKRAVHAAMLPGSDWPEFSEH